MVHQDAIEQMDWASMMQPMLLACPSFQPTWRQFLAEWEDNPVRYEKELVGQLPLYLPLSELANHLIEKLESGDIAAFPAVFDVVERWHLHGTHEVQEAATIGLLEDLASECRYTRMSPEDFIKWLGPETRKWWEEIRSFWQRLEHPQLQ